MNSPMPSAVKENVGHVDTAKRMTSTTVAIWSSMAVLTLLGDSMVSYSRSWAAFWSLSSLIPIVTDSSIHALISGLLWTVSHREGPPTDDFLLSFMKDKVFVGPLRRFSTWLPVFLCACVASSALDADHFFAAESWTLFGATHLEGRPMGHSAVFAFMAPMVILGVLRGLTWMLRGHRRDASPYWALLVFNAIFSHQLRDAERRGLMLWYGVSTKPLPRVFVLGVYVAMARMQCLLLQRWTVVPLTSSHDESSRDNRDDLHFDLEKQLRV